MLDHTGPARDHFAAAPRPAPAVTVFDPTSGRTMEVLTTQPGLQFYSGGNLDGSLHGIGGRYQKFAALAFEPQHLPDSVHRPDFPSSILHPGQTYRQAIAYRFGTRG